MAIHTRLNGGHDLTCSDESALAAPASAWTWIMPIRIRVLLYKRRAGSPKNLSNATELVWLVDMRRGATRSGVIAKVLLGIKNTIETSDPGRMSSFDSLDEETVENARELLQLVKVRIENRYGYIKLISLLLFFSMYLTSISVQQNVSDAFGIESRCARKSCISH
jgi:hypothetical protein